MLTCPWCGDTEPNDMLLRNNHWVRLEGETGYDWCAEHGMCIAMNLTRNHVEHAGRFPVRDHDQLARAIASAERHWAKAGTDWLDPYRALVRPVKTPEHADLAESEAVALW